MKKSVWFVVLAVLLVLLAACGPTVGETKTQFCSDWNELGAAIQNAKSLDENATIEQAKDAQNQIAQAWDKASKSAAELQDVQIDAMRAAYDTFVQTIESIPEEATLGQASTAVQLAVTGLDAAFTTINTTVCVSQ